MRLLPEQRAAVHRRRCRATPTRVAGDRGLRQPLRAGRGARRDAGRPNVSLDQQTRLPLGRRRHDRRSRREAPADLDPARADPGLGAWTSPCRATSIAYARRRPPSRSRSRSTAQPVAIRAREGLRRHRADWAAGDAIEPALARCRSAASWPTPPSRPTTGRVAVERGPLVYAAEFADNGGPRDQPPAARRGGARAPQQRPDLLERRRRSSPAQATAVPDANPAEDGRRDRAADAHSVLRLGSSRPGRDGRLAGARPEPGARPAPEPTLASTRRRRASEGGKSLDGPERTIRARPTRTTTRRCYFHWWPKKGTTEWVQYDFPDPATVSEASGLLVRRHRDGGVPPAEFPGRRSPGRADNGVPVKDQGCLWRREGRVQHRPVHPGPDGGLQARDSAAGEVSPGIQEVKSQAKDDVRSKGTRDENHGVILVAALILLAASGPSRCRRRSRAAGANILVNASFEDVENGLPKGWRPVNYWPEGGDSPPTRRVFTRAAGASEFPRPTGPTPIFRPISSSEPFAKYRLSGWVKTENVKPGTGRGALFNLHGLAAWRPRRSPERRTGRGWRSSSTPRTNDGVSGQLPVRRLGAGDRARPGSTTCQLEVLSAGRAPAARPTIDAGERAAPISKYIYGQFIEHLGRCIYGGIWAEMLEDRKFFYPVGDKESPWKPDRRPAARRRAMNPSRAVCRRHMRRRSASTGGRRSAGRHPARTSLGVVAGQEVRRPDRGLAGDAGRRPRPRSP
ncbi:MAG: hypothetical protein MZV63_06270 [Marinilabiliales bacterium]|nr:hypothetical protein [Marinilabiliales bacterium]